MMDDVAYIAGYAVGVDAGRCEVIEWGKETCPHDLFGEGTQCFKRACDLCWREKWGIEERDEKAE